MFAIVFRSAGSSVLPQQIYSLENEAMGEMKLFLVPVGMGQEDSVLYEAVFNRAVKKA